MNCTKEQDQMGSLGKDETHPNSARLSHVGDTASTRGENS